MPTRFPFLGHFPGLIDDKGRLSIPAEYRHAMPAESELTLVLTPGGAGYVNAFPLDRFNLIWEHADLNVLGFAKADSLVRDAALLVEAVQRQLDSQGRITVPMSLLKQVGIGREVVFMGRWNHFIIWDARSFEEFRSSHKLSAGEAWEKIIEKSEKA